MQHFKSRGRLPNKPRMSQEEYVGAMTKIVKDWQYLVKTIRELIARYQEPGVIEKMAEKWVTDYNSFETDKECREFNRRLGADMVAIYHHRSEAIILHQHLLVEGYLGGTGGSTDSMVRMARVPVDKLRDILDEMQSSEEIIPLKEFL